MEDLHNSIKVTNVLAPAATASTNNTAQVSNVIDTDGFESLEFVILTGTLADADATFTVLVEEGNTGTPGSTTLSDAGAVADADLLGTESGAGFDFSFDGKASKIGYIGTKRYVRLTVTPANNTGNFPVAIAAIQGHAKTLPQSTQKI